MDSKIATMLQDFATLDAAQRLEVIAKLNEYVQDCPESAVHAIRGSQRSTRFGITSIAGGI
ncbi:hypothetical protein NLX83_29330 [Allokutzneria sp. A3M-2-11 16]|uniref:hypothetical protein n=1 Tax=Allokutzneria sp. A3M-2-11 16 TaxID=2962043 RepID=UPI0020B87D4C|nr:hypothetical protein [Allokutzneria sp. A3M-2-11 16]MCP3803384.1 hypothetical protein [Allokutzneria sp. A3M-2-11 16]